MEPRRIEPRHMGAQRVEPGHLESGRPEPGRWPYKPTAIWRKLVAVLGLGAFTAICVIALVALVLVGALVGALVLEALIG
ncbi:hypothetical protein [Candidatus Poriferisodalis sp.]|uniref:hypothetical protein n=1 Tax=Candidatus Poriferisodalis sp. TaxID=3101277 RepID=UPI003B5B3B40